MRPSSISKRQVSASQTSVQASGTRPSATRLPRESRATARIAGNKRRARAEPVCHRRDEGRPIAIGQPNRGREPGDSIEDREGRDQAVARVRCVVTSPE